MTINTDRGEGWHRLARSPVAWLVPMLGLVTLVDLWVLSGRWPYVNGYEVEWIARSLAAGHGFSFPGNRQWLFDFEAGSPDEHFPTAWQAPLYPAWMALCLRLLGAYGQLPVLLGQVLCVRATSVVLYLVGRRLFSPWAGLAAAAVLALSPYTHIMGVGQIGSASLAGLLVALALLVGLWCMGRPTVRRAVAWGMLLGVAILTYAGTQMLAPVAVVVLASRRRPDGGGWAWPAALALALTTTAVVSPWTVRNYLVFGELVPVRSGLGQMAQIGNPIVAQTFASDLRFTDQSPPDPPWTEASAGAALDRLRNDRDARMILNRHARTVVEHEAPPGYAGFNEARRDALYLAQARRFIVHHPGLAAEFAIRKTLGFFFTYWPVPGAIAALGVVGLLLVRCKGQVMLAALWIAAFALPYGLTFPYFYRYRYPIEPLIALFAGVAIVAAVQAVIGWRSRQRAKRPVSLRASVPSPGEAAQRGAALVADGLAGADAASAARVGCR